MRSSAPSKAAPELIGYHVERLLGFRGERPVSDISKQTCLDYVAYRTAQVWKGKRINPQTARRELVTLRASVGAWETPLIARPTVTLPAPGESRQRFLTRQEAAAMLRAARRLHYHHVTRFILLGLYTGTRHGALLGLSWLPSPVGGHLDIDAKIIHRRGSSERDTSKRRPKARIPDRLLAHLKRWRAHDLERGIAHVITWNGRKIRKERKAWDAVVVAAGLGDDVTPHVQRHTCATWLLSEGVKVWDVAALLGTSVKQIEDTYGHHSPEFQDELADAFSGRKLGAKLGTRRTA
jgi:integrase